MSLHWQTPNGPVTAVYVPYSHMDDDDARLFYDTINALLVYANERLGIVDPGALRERKGAPCMLYEHGGQVADMLWRNRWLVDDFVRDNPLHLSQEQLDCARPWRWALRDMFTVVQANEDSVLYMNRTHLFTVGASQDPADSHVHHIPSLMLLTLLPFKGGIVTSGMTIHLSQEPASWAVPLIAQQAKELAERTVIAASGQLIAYGRRISDDENLVTERFQREVDRGFASGLLL
ncbi:hypothetical protein NW198_05460 [Thermophilibacter sp. ET337]|uniref:hypothetical protein n=1 Tax=Thermophilibacter sp. ET337 TaxID=2973084 RepID=UPI0021AC9086|nr:hypothetical protein [Thermophilibacter sp. ET337]MCR8908067.1 hypothetical protein [Thermophilibacter sp. ET337]